MKFATLLGLVCLLAACSTPGSRRRDASAAPLTGAPEQQAEARAIAAAQNATTLYDANSGHAGASGQATPPADRTNLAQIQAQIAENHAAFSDGRWMARQLDGETWQVVYAYKLNNLDYSYRFIVDLAHGKVRLS